MRRILFVLAVVCSSTTWLGAESVPSPSGLAGAVTPHLPTYLGLLEHNGVLAIGSVVAVESVRARLSPTKAGSTLEVPARRLEFDVDVGIQGCKSRERLTFMLPLPSRPDPERLEPSDAPKMRFEDTPLTPGLRDVLVVLTQKDKSGNRWCPCSLVIPGDAYAPVVQVLLDMFPIFRVVDMRKRMTELKDFALSRLDTQSPIVARLMVVLFVADDPYREGMLRELAGSEVQRVLQVASELSPAEELSIRLGLASAGKLDPTAEVVRAVRTLDSGSQMRGLRTGVYSESPEFQPSRVQIERSYAFQVERAMSSFGRLSRQLDTGPIYELAREDPARHAWAMHVLAVRKDPRAGPLFVQMIKARARPHCIEDLVPYQSGDLLAALEAAARLPAQSSKVGLKPTEAENALRAMSSPEARVVLQRVEAEKFRNRRGNAGVVRQ